MEWSKLKNIILIILAAANLFLLVLVQTRQERSAAYERSARTDAVAVLADSGIAAREDELPEDISLPPLTMERNQQAEAEAAAALLGTVTESVQGSVTVYAGQDGSLRFSRTGEFSAELEAGVAAVGKLTEEKHTLAILKLLNFEAGELTAETDGARTVVTAPQLWQGVPVFSRQAVLVYEDGSLRSIQSGDSRRLTGQPTVSGQTVRMSAVTGLMQFLEGIGELGDVCTQLTGMTAGYSFSAGFSDPITLTPVWYITTDTGAYYLDASAGTLTRAE